MIYQTGLYTINPKFSDQSNLYLTNWSNKYDRSMALVKSFEPIVRPDATILILGSMPSVNSIQAHQYYAHPRNCFWYIIETLFSSKCNLDYADRVKLLLENRIALWDVLKQCTRRGSLDSAIDTSSIETQDFNTFYSASPNIKTVFFNGTAAEKEYYKRVKPQLSQPHQNMMHHRLPSTSPAMASLNREQKLNHWKVVKKSRNIE